MKKSLVPGRIHRLEYLIIFILFIICHFTNLHFIEESFRNQGRGYYLFAPIYYPMLIIFIFKSTQRAHDIGSSGWYQLIPFYHLVLLFRKGDTTPNRFGPLPNEKTNQNIDAKELIDVKSSDEIFTDVLAQIKPIEGISNLEEKANTSIINHQPIKGETPKIKKDNYIKRFYKLITFNNATYRSVFDEGTRRMLIIVSVIIPLLLTFLFLLITEYDDDFSYAFQKSIQKSLLYSWTLYFPFHIAILLYIWIREGKKTVQPGGNAIRTILNILLIHVFAGVIFATVGIIYTSNENPYNREFTLTNELPPDFKYNEHFADWLYNNEEFGFNKEGTYKEFLYALSTPYGRSQIKWKSKNNVVNFENSLFWVVNEEYATEIRNLYLEVDPKWKVTLEDLIYSILYDHEKKGEVLDKIYNRHKNKINLSFEEFKNKMYIKYDH